MYEKKTISQTKLWKMSTKDLANYVNIETWEYLDIVVDRKESKKIYIKLNYKFTMINKDIDNKKLLWLIWATYYGYLLLLCNYIKTDNRVDLDILPIKWAWLVKFKWIMKKYWIIIRIKLDDMNKWEYFINPYISSYWREITLELKEAFKEINKKMYNITL